MKYEKIEPISREEAEAIICNGDPEAIGLTLIRLAYHHRDWRWVQDLCIGLSEHEDKWVRRNCATCFGHLARIHRKIDLEKVNPVLRRLLDDADAHGWAEDICLKCFWKRTRAFGLVFAGSPLKHDFELVTMGNSQGWSIALCPGSSIAPKAHELSRRSGLDQSTDSS